MRLWSWHEPPSLQSTANGANEMNPFVALPAVPRQTSREILDEWPPGQERPSDKTLWRWLDRAAARNLLLREGASHRTEPFRYWLSEKEAVWRSDPVWKLMQQQQRELMKRLER